MNKPFEATMYFRYGKNKKPGVTADSTFEAVLRGERISTTRFDIWGNALYWSRIKAGDEIRFFEDKDKKGRYIDVIVDYVYRVNLVWFDDDEMEAWSLVEGWSFEYGRQISSRGPATQILYHVKDKKMNQEPKIIEFVRPNGEISYGETIPGEPNPIYEKSLDAKIADVCHQIRYGLDMSPEGSFDFRIRRLIDELPKPDIFISHAPEDGVRIYSNHPEQIGKIQVYETPDLNLPPTEMRLYNPNPDLLQGNADEWQEKLETGTVNVKQFLEIFMIKNT